MLASLAAGRFVQLRLEKEMAKFMSDVHGTIPELHEKICILLQTIRSREAGENILEILKECSEELQLATIIGLLPKDAVLLESLTTRFNRHIASIIFELAFHRDPVRNLQNFHWMSTAFQEMTGRSDLNVPALEFNQGDPDFCMHHKMEDYIDRFMTKNYDHPAWDLDNLKDSFQERYRPFVSMCLHYNLDLNGKGAISLLMGVGLSFTFEDKFFISYTGWRIDFGIDILDHVVEYALNDNTLHTWDLSQE